jgi:hypothetical protein
MKNISGGGNRVFRDRNSTGVASLLLLSSSSALWPLRLRGEIMQIVFGDL